MACDDSVPIFLQQATCLYKGKVIRVNFKTTQARIYGLKQCSPLLFLCCAQLLLPCAVQGDPMLVS